jgi:hypothetical protein
MRAAHGASPSSHLAPGGAGSWRWAHGELGWSAADLTVTGSRRRTGGLQPRARSPCGGLCACVRWPLGDGRDARTRQSLVADSVLERGGILSMARCSCAVSSRVSEVGGWRRQDLEALVSVLVGVGRASAACYGGMVGPASAFDRIWCMALASVHHPCVGGCWIRWLVVAMVDDLVVVESDSSLVHAPFCLFSRQIWQTSWW